MLKTSIRREKTQWMILGCVQPGLNIAFQVTYSTKGHACWQHSRGTYCTKWTKKNKPRLQGLLKITSSIVVKYAGSTLAAQREQKTTLFRKATASKPAVQMPRIIKGGGNYEELVKDEIFLDFGGKKNGKLMRQRSPRRKIQGQEDQLQQAFGDN